ncbi:MAG: hypothetical protein JW974_01370 [Alphaproteobacteria bacterium]|nr:hypothetical protein [Alphaproteobacteria bacterium]MBN2675433.1 hypothetical protein [Alphaproteobacteria bacterium]
MTEFESSEILNQNSDKSRNGITWILLIIMIISIAFLTYLLFTKSDKRTIRTNPVPEHNLQKKQISNIIENKINNNFTDGLGNPNSTTQYDLDEFGAGIETSEVFNIDINGDNKKDKIIRNKYENGTDHFYYDYKIELNTANEFINITPIDFRTIEGAECSLQKLQFIFKPNFQVIKISRNWKESWVNPTMATKTVYNLIENQLKPVSSNKLKNICDVSELF